ncbi:uncharacterized protein LOC110686084 [Chenopodium quinoa]|uniref:RNase H type-1 domain-containing protein n=1 Tax=Chenopodium quinoa TaxID=63459 RepID=A0A803L7P3_CHEQI|nr:uncharacterized protein LOC110686084 [Chenopodium quinoa]
MSNNQWSILRGSTYGKMYTLNFDGSHNNQANKCGAGCVIRDSQGELVVAAAYNLTETYSEYCNVAIVEAVALCNGLKLAKERNLNLNLIKGDNTEVIDLVLGRSRSPSRPQLSGIIQQIVGMIDCFSQKIVPINREANQVADKLASWGCNRLQEGGRKIYTTSADLPPQVAELIRKEKSISSRNIERHDGEGSSLVEDVVKVGAAVSGVVKVARGLWDMYKLMSGESSSSETERYDHCTLHYSGSDRNQVRSRGAGCVIRNEHGNLVIAAAYNLDHLDEYNVAIAEAIAWRNGLELAKTQKVKLDRINGDNEEIIKRVLGLERKPPCFPSLNEIIDEIKKALCEQSIDPRSQVQRIGTTANKTTNELAISGSKLGFRMEKSYDKEEDLPFKVAQSFQQDKKMWRNGVMAGFCYATY